MSIVVYDLEFTTWEGAQARGWSGPGEFREIVQIGAVRLDDAWRETDALDVLVRPCLNPVLSDYFIQLTGILQEQVDRHGLSFAQAQERLAAFAGPDAPLCANGRDGEVWLENCRLLSVPSAFAADRFRDVRATIGAMAGRDGVISCDLAATFGLAEQGRAHTGLADARAVAAALRLARQRKLL